MGELESSRTRCEPTPTIVLHMFVFLLTNATHNSVLQALTEQQVESQYALVDDSVIPADAASSFSISNSGIVILAEYIYRNISQELLYVR